MEVTVHNSSTVSHIRYNPKTNEMTLQFKSGNVYVYRNVGQAIAAAICMADSPGAEFNRLIRNAPKKYPFYKNNRLVAGIERVQERTTNGEYTKSPNNSGRTTTATKTKTTTPRRRAAVAKKTGR